MTDDLYALLPALHRVRDAESGGALHALVSVLAAQADVLDDNIAQLYDNWFIETCDEAMAAYLGDLLGARPLHAIGNGISGPRAYVANTIGYRRRKGTATVLEQLALDVTGWPARAVEFFSRLAASERLGHLRPDRPAFASVRRATTLELLGGPFEQAAHTAESREPARGGRYGIRTIGLFLWRLAAFGVVRGTARPVTQPADGRYRVNPLGLDAPLFNPSRREAEITHLAQETDVPALLRRRPLAAELDGLRAGAPPAADGWFSPDPVLRLYVDGTEMAPAQLSICDLDTWRRPTAPGVAAAIDPVLGRIALPAGQVPTSVEISYWYGFSSQLGGGPYDQTDTLDDPAYSQATFAAAVSSHLTGSGIHATLADAVQDWAAQPAGTVGVIALLDSASYPESVAIDVPAGSALFLVAGRLPDGVSVQPDHLILGGVRPHLAGDLTVTGVAGLADAAAGRCTLSGLLVEGALTANGLGALSLSHTTVAPGAATTISAPADQPLAVTLRRTITGPLTVTGDAELSVTDAIVDGPVDAADCDADLDSATMLGLVDVRRLAATDCLLTGVVTAQRRQDGCVRFSYVTPGSHTPRRHRYEPDQSGAPAPSFTSLRYGDPGYGQLVSAGPLWTGGSSGAEMGAFSHLRQPQRVENLRVSLDEYLPAGLTAGSFFVT
jgi:hypothetical protein